jgi:hypothetical protein
MAISSGSAMNRFGRRIAFSGIIQFSMVLVASSGDVGLAGAERLDSQKVDRTSLSKSWQSRSFHGSQTGRSEVKRQIRSPPQKVKPPPEKVTLKKLRY